MHSSIWNLLKKSSPEKESETLLLNFPITLMFIFICFYTCAFKSFGHVKKKKSLVYLIRFIYIN